MSATLLSFCVHRDFAIWRDIARGLLAANVLPELVVWRDEGDATSLLAPADSAVPPPADETKLNVPRSFLDLATLVACHRDEDRWNLLYRSLWRLTRGGVRGLLERFSDDDVLRLNDMERAVRRDRHKMTAFVRFKLVPETNAETGEKVERYVAWHKPDHFIVRPTAPFFAKRFATLNWAILTPDDSAFWDGTELSFGPGVPASQAPAADELESLWRTYYANIFNPARVKIHAMKRELPVRHWPTLPESDLIADLVANAPRRAQDMIRKARETAKPSKGKTPGSESTAGRWQSRSASVATSAEAFIPPSRELPVLASASKGCRGCHLCEVGTQTVFGEGPATAKVVFVGEQPGDQEDRLGRPFVGPAGQLLNDVLEEVGIVRDDCYVTNTVKHFKWEPRGKRRIHVKPNAREISACLPWLRAELEAIRPTALVCLGATAAQALLGRDFRVTERRGEHFKSDWSEWTMATIHPSALLRIPDPELKERNYKQFVEDLRIVAKRIHAMRS